jgi:hypothetical protein
MSTMVFSTWFCPECMRMYRITFMSKSGEEYRYELEDEDCAGMPQSALVSSSEPFCVVDGYSLELHCLNVETSSGVVLDMKSVGRG